MSLLLPELKDFMQENDTTLDRIDYPLFRAMAAYVKKLRVTPEEFVMCMRYATMANVYYQDGETPVILGMRIEII